MVEQAIYIIAHLAFFISLINDYHNERRNSNKTTN